MEKLRILIVCGELEMDSPSVYSVDIAEEFIRQGHAVRFVCAGSKCDVLLNNLKERRASQDTGLDGQVVLEVPGLNSPILSFYRRYELKRAVRNFRPHIVHATVEGSESTARSLAEAAGVPFVVTCHKYADSPPFPVSKRLAKVIAVSDDLRQHLVNEAGMPKDLISVVPNGVNIRKYDMALSESHDRVPVVGTFGKLVPRKGHPYFVNAAARIIKSGTSAHFLLCGDGPEENSLRELVETLEITESVTFSFYPFRAHSVIREMDIFVLTSLQETLGFPALEALAYGKAVVAFGVGGIYSFLKDGETGLVVSVKDTDGLVKAIVRLIEDPDLRVKLGRQGRALVEEKFSMSSIAERLLTQYSGALSSTGGGGLG